MKKKLFSLVMAAAMLMTMAVPAFATGGPDHNPVGENSITITNSPVYTLPGGTKEGADYSGYLLMTLVTSLKCTDTHDPGHQPEMHGYS